MFILKIGLTINNIISPVTVPQYLQMLTYLIYKIQIKEKKKL